MQQHEIKIQSHTSVLALLGFFIVAIICLFLSLELKHAYEVIHSSCTNVGSYKKANEFLADGAWWLDGNHDGEPCTRLKPKVK